ncbi:MAG: hypothetical protein L3K19_02950 [Thermoplasmata archaeon]|nr:hypothetical protein [Thermoplasmata archaeon]
MPQDEASADRPPRRRESWSLTTLVEEVAGRPITEFQEPGRPVHPYIQVKFPPNAPARSARPGSSPGSGYDAPSPVPEEEEGGPVGRVFPPLTGATGRALHGPDQEHHAPTLRSVTSGSGNGGPGAPSHPPGPSRRPERIYLHYLLLHLDRLSGPALRYLKLAVDEEVSHRDAPPEATPPTETSSPPERA